MNETRAAEHTMEEHRTVRVSRRIRATPERVYDAWLDPDRVKTWMLSVGADDMVTVALDPKIGGAFTFVVRRDGANLVHGGEYLTLDRPRRLSFTWRVPRISLETSLVTIALSAAGDETEVSLEHQGVFAEDEARTELGWGTILESIATMVSSPEETSRAAEDRPRDVR